MTQQARTDDPWLGGPSGSAKYTEPQRKKMIIECVKRDLRVGCSCSGCPVHPGMPCPLAHLPQGVNMYKVLTPQHLKKGPADHHLTNLKAFCQPCNRNTPSTRPYPQPSVRVRKSPQPGVGGAQADQSVRLVQRHEWERPAWDEWVGSEKPWSRLRKEGLFVENWAQLQDLVDLAAGELSDSVEGKGSSVTFRRYAMEDRFTILELVKEKGRIYVRPREGRQK